MGRQQTDLEVVTPLPALQLADTVTMTDTEAGGKLMEFAQLNGFTYREYTETLALFQQAADQPGDPVVVPTVFDLAEMAAARRRHALMAAISDNPVATELAVRATGALPGTHFEHDLRGDACRLTATCTNAA